jgi:glucose/arabinose dehydrogenase
MYIPIFWTKGRAATRISVGTSKSSLPAVGVSEIAVNVTSCANGFNNLGVTFLGFVLGALFSTGCYALRPSSGGGQHSSGERRINEDDVAVPAGYKVTAVAQGLTFPTAAAFDATGNLYVIESGYSYGEVFTTPRLLKIDGNSREQVIATGSNNGPWTGVTFYEGNFYIAEGGVNEGGRILKITPSGQITTIVDGLPSYGDHHTDGPVVSPDGWLYFGQGTASNSGVVGEDNQKFGWLKRHPEFHDIPGADISVVGTNFKSRDGKRTGGFVPFGTETTPGQIIQGQIKCSGSVLRVRPDGSGLERVAWGFRNPFGLAFAPDKQLYVTDNGYDERGSRPIWGAADILWRIEPGIWYGWPDYSAGEPVTMNKFKPPHGPQPQFLLATHPGVPPEPVAKFGVHSSADGLDFSHSNTFGHVGEAFVALLGDEAPSTGKLLHAVGFKVVRVDPRNGVVEDFAVNRGSHNGPASKIGSGGLERPVSVKFNPSGDALYIVDFGVLLQDRIGAKPQKRTGTVWKVTKG